ncbi:hypothetical protein CDL12_03408 [Handroanthus impetiginosus]|uniref:Uncharacterized protein n=1 Tax=Handroanthus impetiginosus TaxID=429701 RepID=A0A2G9I269_9LAMI|nr:hypothetical protein CDL12_03408 [Handroanthus impetiginosus]
MGQGAESETRAEPSIEIQERGEIFFFYRPKVDKEEAQGAEDVQRLYLVLRPESGQRSFEEKQAPHSGKEGAKQMQAEYSETNKEEREEEEGGGTGGGHGSHQVNIEEQPLLRFIVMGRKSLPNTSNKGTPYWGFVEMVTTQIEHLKAALKGEQYETATRGHRHLPDARAVGEGVYRILKHTDNTSKPGIWSSKRMHTHLIYKLEYPPEGEEEKPQEALNIAREASFLIQIKNPEQHQQGQGGFRGGLKKKRKAAFPAHLQGLFGNNRNHPADPPDFLNYEGCEFLLISAADDIEQELDLDLKIEQEQDAGAGLLAHECSDLIKTFGEDAASTRPLFEGTWV